MAESSNYITILVVLLWHGFALFHSATVNAIHKEEEQALLQLTRNCCAKYDDQNPCSRYGIGCTNGSIVEIWTSQLCGCSSFQSFGDINLTAFPNLQYLELCGMFFLSGSIPSQIGDLQKLTYLDLSHNDLSGMLPATLTNLRKLIYLDLSFNRLSGMLPATLTNLQQLTHLNLAGNNFHRDIPLPLYDLTLLRILYLQSNQINASLNPRIGNLTNLENLDLSNNKIFGSIPPQIGNLYRVNSIDLSHNSITGNIPSLLGKLSSKICLDLSYNNLTESIPIELANMSHIDISYNSLSGFVPFCYSQEFVIGNKGIIGPQRNLTCYDTLRSKVDHHLKIILPIIIIFVIMLFGAWLASRFMTKKTKFVESAPPKNGDLFSIWNFDGKIAYEDIIEATEDFDIKYCIGIGAYGSVYRANFQMAKLLH